MEHLQSLIHSMTASASPKTGLAASFISIISAVFAFTTALQHIQVMVAICASIVAMVSGGFAIRYYHLQIKKMNQS